MSGVVPPRPPSSGPPPLPSQGATLSDNLRVVASRGQVDNARDLLAAGAGFEPDEEGRTALHLAAQQGHTDVCKVLTSHGCEVNAQDTMGYSPLLRASSQGAQDTVHMLLESGCDPDLQDEHGNAAIHEACWNGFSKSAEVLVNYHCNVCLTNRAGFTPLHLAAQNGHNECSRVLLYAGCDANMKNNYGDTALHTAARYGHAGVARILISAKCLLSEQNKNGDTALHIASALKRRKIAKILVESGLDTDLLNKQGETASDVAQRKDHPEIVIIISNFSKAKPKQPSRRHLEGHGVTFKDEIELADGPVVCPEDEPPLKPEPEPKAEKEKQERRFFFFKKKKKDTKDKPSPTTPTGAGQTNAQGKQTPRLFPTAMQQQQAERERQKAAVLGFFSQYVPRDGVQLYRDLAGNVKQGPIGYAPVCQCGPSLKRLESSIADTHQTFHHQLDSSHNTLNQRIHNLNLHVNRQAGNLRSSMRDRFEEEHGRCHDRISERLTEERMETEFLMERNNEGMKDDIESWLNDKLASYGHCLDHHHDDTALPPRNLFFDFPTMGRLVRSRSDETLSVSDYSGKNKKKDFYASRQAAMQQIRGWEVPGVEGRGRQPLPKNINRRKELVNNNHIASNKNILVSAAEVHHPPPHIRNPSTPNPHNYADHHHQRSLSHQSPVDNKVLSPSTNSTTSPDMPASYRNRYPYHPHTAQRPTPTTANDHSDRSRPHPRVSFSPDPYHQYQHHHPHQRQPNENPYHSASPSPGPPKAVLKPSSQYTHPHPHQPQPHPRHSNLLGGGPPNAVDLKSVEQGDSSKTAAQLNGQNNVQRDNNTHSVSSEQSSGVTLDSSSQESKYGSLRNQMKRYQDDYGIHYKRNDIKLPDANSTPANPPPTYPRPMPRSRSVDNTLEENSHTQHASGYVTDSGIRPSSRGANPTRQYTPREQQSPSPGPPPRSATRYRLPETSSGYNSQPPYSRVQSPRVQSPSGYNKGQPHSILKGGSANTLNTAGTDRHNHHDVTFSKDIAGQIGLNRFSNPTTDRNPQSVSMYGINSAGKVSPLVYNNETYARIEDFSSGRLDVPSKSDSNILSSSSGNDTPLLDCLQHDSFLSPSASPSPNYIHGSITNKEDSTCSSNQDSGYDSRANRIDGGIRRNIGGGDNSTGTPSSSFSMERTSCVTSNWSGSPINTSTDAIHHDFVKDSSTNNRYDSSAYPSNSQYDLGVSPRSPPASEERDASKTPNAIISNSYGRSSGRDFSPFRQGDAIRSHLLPQSLSSNIQQRNNNMHENNSNNNNRIYEKVPSVTRDSSDGRSSRIPSNNDGNNSNNPGTMYNGRSSTSSDYQPINAYSVRNQSAHNYNSGDELYGDRNSIRRQNGHNAVSTPNQPQQNRMSQRSFSPGPPSAQRRFQSPTPQNRTNKPPPPPPSSSTNRTPQTYQGNPTYSGMTNVPQYNNNNNSSNNNQNNDSNHFTNNQRLASAIASPSPNNNSYQNNNNNNNTPKQPHQQQQQYHQHQQPSTSPPNPECVDATQNKVQAHVEGWYQRKLMEAAQRLRENHDYSLSPTHSNTPMTPQGHPYNSQHPQEPLHSASASSYQQLPHNTQEGYRNNYNNNNIQNSNNNNNMSRPPPYHSHSFHSRQSTNRPSDTHHSDGEGFTPQHNGGIDNNNVPTSSSNPSFNHRKNSSHVVPPYHPRTPSSFSNSNGDSRPPLPPQYAVAGGWGNNRGDATTASVYHSNSNNGISAPVLGAGGGSKDLHFVRRGSVTPMRYDPIHGSDV